jgi:hypothetical protein
MSGPFVELPAVIADWQASDLGRKPKRLISAQYTQTQSGHIDYKQYIACPGENESPILAGNGSPYDKVTNRVKVLTAKHLGEYQYPITLYALALIFQIANEATVEVIDRPQAGFATIQQYLTTAVDCYIIRTPFERTLVVRDTWFANACQKVVVGVEEIVSQVRDALKNEEVNYAMYAHGALTADGPLAVPCYPQVGENGVRMYRPRWTSVPDQSGNRPLHEAAVLPIITAAKLAKMVDWLGPDGQFIIDPVAMVTSVCPAVAMLDEFINGAYNQKGPEDFETSPRHNPNILAEDTTQYLFRDIVSGLTPRSSNQYGVTPVTMVAEAMATAIRPWGVKQYDTHFELNKEHRHCAIELMHYGHNYFDFGGSSLGFWFPRSHYQRNVVPCLADVVCQGTIGDHEMRRGMVAAQSPDKPEAIVEDEPKSEEGKTEIAQNALKDYMAYNHNKYGMQQIITLGKWHVFRQFNTETDGDRYDLNFLLGQYFGTSGEIAAAESM